MTGTATLINIVLSCNYCFVLIDQVLKLAALISLQVSIMAAIRHPNVVMFMGICLSPVCIVTEFCARGSLSDVIKKAASSAVFAQQLDWPKRITMALDAAKVSTASTLLRTTLSGCSKSYQSAHMSWLLLACLLVCPPAQSRKCCNDQALHHSHAAYTIAYMTTEWWQTVQLHSTACLLTLR